MWIRLDGGEALYLQIYRAYRQAILDGKLDPGHRLPPTRQLARDLSVSRNVTVLAYEQLLAEGYVEARVGAGTFVAPRLPEIRLPRAEEDSRHPPPRPRLSKYGLRALAQRPIRRPRRAEPLEPAPRPRLDFRYGAPSFDGAAARPWRRLLLRHMDRVSLDYAPPGGDPELRRVLAGYVTRSRAVQCEPSQVLIVTGSQQALDLAARVLLEQSDAVVIEDPHYEGARQVFRSLDAQLIAIPVDDHGLDIEKIPEWASESKVRLAYVTPSHQFPTGAVMPLARRLALLSWAEANEAVVLEDDYDSEYRYSGRPVEAVQGLDRWGRTIYIGTLSKVLFPALRLGYLVLPKSLIEPFEAAKWLADRHTPILEQAVLADFIGEGHFERHLRRSRTRNAERRAALLEAVAEHLGDRVEVTGTNAGVHLLMWLRGVRLYELEALIAAAAVNEVGVYPVDQYFLRPPSRPGLLLGYASLSCDEIREGIRRLARVLG